MAIRVYNTLTNRKEPFETVVPGKVSVYLCGPTVYKPSHIGHAVGPIIFDAIKRYLTSRGYQVTLVVNITDVDDKLIVEAREQGTTVRELAQRIEASYHEALGALGVDSIDHFPRASEYIGEIINFIQRLVDRNAAYVAEGDVYFDVTADADYGKLSNRRTDDQLGQRELQSGPKRNPGDFALWKAAKPDEPDDVRFDSPWGPGRPGWHIECSAMSMKLLGETLDVHAGGMDLIFPHHENEIAQSETCTGQPFARYWLHNGLTRFNTKKVSKSDPTMQAALREMTLSNLLGQYSGELLRFFVLSTHYRRPIEYSTDELASKRKGLRTFFRLFERIRQVTGQCAYAATTENTADPEVSAPEHIQALRIVLRETRQRFQAVMDDDFNTAAAIAELFDLANALNRFIEAHKLEQNAGVPEQAALLAGGVVLVQLGRTLGLFQAPPQEPQVGDEALDGLMAVMLEVRSACRQARDFTLADLIRDRLAQLGVRLEDKAGATGWALADGAVGQAVSGLFDGAMDLLVEVRRGGRAAGNYQLADTIRDRLDALGIALVDEAQGTSWRRKA